MSTPEKILIASDHAGANFRGELIHLLKENAKGALEFIDLGTNESGSVDYPDYAALVARDIAAKKATRGILICGSGIGMSIAANKFQGIRAALCDNPVSAQLSREHNDANVLCLASRFLSPFYAAIIAKVFIETRFSDDPRHKSRIAKIAAIEETQ